MRKTLTLLILLALGAPDAALAEGDKGPRAANPTPTALPGTSRAADELACRKNRDCVFLPPICPDCPPCEPTWRTVGNRHALKRIRGMQALVNCRAPRCRKCAPRWLGKRPICRDRRCTVEGQDRHCYKRCLRKSSMQAISSAAIEAQCRHRCGLTAPSAKEPPRLPWSKDRACKRDKDCRLLPTRCRNCAPCKPTWRPVGNHAAAARILKGPKGCPKVRCKRCGDAKNLLGRRAVCVRGQCEPRH